MRGVSSHIIVLVALALFALDAYAFLPRSTSSARGHRSFSMVQSEAKPGRVLVDPIFDEKCSTVGVTLSRYMVEVVEANPNIRELESMMIAIQTACKAISNEVERATITGLVGLEDGGGSINVQGEEQKKLDIITNEILTRALKFSNKVGVIASEEVDEPTNVGNQLDKYKDIGLRTTQFKSDVLRSEGKKYCAVFDPLDGSSNVDACIPTGTIFGIFEEPEECDLDNDDCLLVTLQPGSSLVAAGYCLYSSSTMFCLTLGNGVNIFTLDKQIGEFVLTHPNVKIPKRGKIVSFNEANRLDWDKPLQNYMEAVQTGKGETGNKYSSRYIGSMVGDVHRTLLYGGIFGYPATTGNPNGKLRLLYEAAPMSFLVEQAGGLSLTGKNRIMDLKPKTVHQRVPCIMGSPEDVQEAKKYYDESTDPDLIARCNARVAW